jgi:hypothetical protein
VRAQSGEEGDGEFDTTIRRRAGLRRRAGAGIQYEYLYGSILFSRPKSSASMYSLPVYFSANTAPIISQMTSTRLSRRIDN